MRKPRWLALLALVIAVCYVFALLGMWQVNVARDHGRQEAQTAALARPVVPIDDVIRPHQAMNDEAAARMVNATGTYDASRQVLITGRKLGDRHGYWVVTPLKTANGALLPVLRGFVERPGDAGRPAATPVEVTGMFAPDEGPPDRRVVLPAGQLQKVELGELVNRWPEDLYNGFVFATNETPVLSWGAGSKLTAVPPPDAAPQGLDWRNVSYAAQWWVFAGFGAYMWWRMVREDLRRDRLIAARRDAPGAGRGDGPGGPGAPPDDVPGGQPGGVRASSEPVTVPEPEPEPEPEPVTVPASTPQEAPTNGR